MTRTTTTHGVGRRLVALLTLAIVLAVVEPAAGASVSQANGYTTTTIESAGVTLAVPSSWLRIDPTSQSATNAMQAAVDKNPQLSGLFGQFESIRSQVRYWVLSGGTAKFARNLLVLPTPYDTATLEQPAAVEQSLRATLAHAVETLRVRKSTIDGSPALRGLASLGVTTVDGKQRTLYATFLFVATKQGVINLDYTGVRPPATDNTLATIVNSIRVL